MVADAHATTLVMSRWHDRDWLLSDVDAVAEACAVNVREPIHQEPRWFVSDVKQCMVVTAAFHFTVDRPGHDIAWGE